MNEVKRALVFWPAFTSALIVLLALLVPIQGESWDSLGERVDEKWQLMRGNRPANNEIAENEWTPANDVYANSDNTQPKEPPKTTEVEPELVVTRQVSPEIPASSPAIELINPDPVEREETGAVTMPLPERIVEQTPETSGEPASINDLLGGERLSSIDPTPAIQSLDLPTTEQIKKVIIPFDSAAQGLPEIKYEVATEPETPSDLGDPKSAAIEPAMQALGGPQQDSVNETIEATQPAETKDLILEETVDAEPANAPEGVAITLPAIEDEVVSPSVQVAEQPAMPKQVIERIAEVTPVQPEIKQPVPVAEQQTREPRVIATPAGPWPRTVRLLEQLDQLTKTSDAAKSQSNRFASSRSVISAAKWTSDVKANLESLRSLSQLSDPRAQPIIDELKRLSFLGYDAAERVSVRQEQVDWLTAAHSLSRRIAIWGPVHQIVHGSSEFVSDTQYEITTANQIKVMVQRVEADLSETGDVPGWSRYLMLEKIVDSAASESSDRSLLAQKFLSRLTWHGLSNEHRQWMNRESVNQLRDSIMPWARAPIDYKALLSQIESQEASSIDMAAVDIAGTAQTLRFSEQPMANKLANELNTHYRNANIRTAISEELLRRMLPEVEPKRMPIRTNMLGSRVRGVSDISSNLQLDLRPASNHWSMMLRTTGDIETHSVGRQDQTSISTKRRSDYLASTPILITSNGIQIGDSQIDVQGKTRLRGIRTGYDNWPLIGSLVHSIAETRYRQNYGTISRLSNRRVESQIDQELDQQLNKKADKLSMLMSEIVMGPFSQLQLSPKVIDMQSTEDRLVARYRLAGDWQIGAFTPRPRAPKGNLISLQVNQSALNNTLDRVVPDEEPTTIEETFYKTMKMFGQNDVRLPEDIPTDVRIQFTKSRPITVEVQDGMVWLTMRIVELSGEKGAKLRRFIVRAAYRPEINDLNVSLVRDGHLRISGPGMSMRQRLPIRAIFNKVLSPNHGIPLTTPSLAEHPALQGAVVSQLELRDGWIAIAFSDREQVIADRRSEAARR